MTRNVISVPDTSSVEDAARLLARHRISGLPVVDEGGALIGLVTEHDMISKSGATVADIMTRGVVSISADTELEEVTHLLTNKRIRRVPVLDGNRLVGIVSRSDLVRQIAMRWVCHTCGADVRSADMPEHCPICGAPDSAFVHEIELPGM
jgi:CBS domain-containing protein